jgi:hypothetical protein
MASEDDYRRALGRAAANGPAPDPATVFVGTLGMTLEAALSRARAVGVLDAWEDADPDARRIEYSRDDITHRVELVTVGVSRRAFRGSTRDAARAAAARAIEEGKV